MQTIVYRIDNTLFDLRALYQHALHDMGTELGPMYFPTHGASDLLAALGPAEFGRVFASKYEPFAEDFERAVRRCLSQSKNIVVEAFGATASLETLHQERANVLFSSALSRPTLQMLFERAGWRAPSVHSARLRNDDTSQAVQRLFAAKALPDLDEAIWVCGSPYDLAWAAEIGGAERILVARDAETTAENNSVLTVLPTAVPDESAAVFTVPTIGLVPELLRRLGYFHDAPVTRRSGVVARRATRAA
jgi:phosphoglycolate phosphatase-like HAD superfamily hydrolase